MSSASPAPAPASAPAPAAALSDVAAPLEAFAASVAVPAGDYLVPLLDGGGALVGAKLRSALGAGDVSRVVNVFVQRADGRVWVPVRSPARRRFPGCLDFSAAGHVRLGESDAAALARVLADDASLDVAGVVSQQLVTLTPADGVSDVMAVFVVRASSPRLPDGGFASAGWWLPGELADRLGTGVPAKPDLAPTLARVLPALAAL
jgi:hypothetical protein